MGLHRAGFDVVGVDIAPQPNYPFKFIQADALALAIDLMGFDYIWASPPCQRYTNAQKLMGNEHPDLVEPTREKIAHLGIPYTIENVPGAPLRRPTILCGSMFGLRTYRHRLFENNFPVEQLLCSHTTKQTKMGRKPIEGEFIQVVGNFSGIKEARAAMGIDWMNQGELAEAIPPAYSEFIGRAALRALSPWRTGGHRQTAAEGIVP